MPAPATDNRAATVVQHVQRLIQVGALPPGAPLPSEGQLSATLGISRGMVREGYRMLAATGAVTLRNGRAPRVAALNADPIAAMFRHVLDTRQVSAPDVLEFRRATELQAAPLAALRRSDAQAAALLAAAAAMQDTPDLLPQDLAFHELLADSSGNPLFSVIAQTFRVLTERSIRQGQHHYTDPFHRTAYAEAHLEIARSIQQRDPTHAQQAMQRHYEQAELATLL
ncbi:FadR/GntR family transcriptional regulator [Deinococcus radiotolerans]|uniref:FadR/GntR family transcriptional regulator n=1 Tax=Deinococcus radiotolerans TaxID=1309407 RepID=UPI001668752A|nr:FCD domain-containing protein [Deinococcus radiotolerans]